MRLIRKYLFILACLPGLAPLAATAQTKSPVSAEELHNELRALKQRVLDSINKNNSAALLDEMAPDVVFTAMNNENVRGLEQARAYHARMMVGADKIVQAMSMTAEADDLSKFYADNTMAISTGTSNAHFEIKGGLNFDIPLRWTSTLDRSSGRWKIAALHFSANALDNPILAGVTTFWKWLAGGLGALALVLAFALLRLRKRRLA